MKKINSINKKLDAKSYKVVIPDMIYQQCMWWTHKAKRNEVSWLGTVKFDRETGIFTPQRLVMIKQENSSSETTMDPESVAEAMWRLRSQGLDEGEEIKWWCHSHVMMNVFWSSTDMEAMRQLGLNGWILSTVFNQKNEYRSAFLSSSEVSIPALNVKPEKHEVFIDEIPTTVQRYLDNDLVDKWDKEFDENVSEKKIVVHAGYKSKGKKGSKKGGKKGSKTQKTLTFDMADAYPRHKNHPDYAYHVDSQYIWRRPIYGSGGVLLSEGYWLHKDFTDLAEDDILDALYLQQVDDAREEYLWRKDVDEIIADLGEDPNHGFFDSLTKE